ncbi:MAG: DNA methyltransferase [bacterium]
MGKVIEGDSLDVLKFIPAASFDMIVADPPYSISVASSGGGKLNPWADLLNASRWFTELYRDVKRILKPSGAFWSFHNWQTVPVVHKAAYESGWKVTSQLVWNKAWIGPGQRGLRPSYELVSLFAGEDFNIEDRGIPDIKEFPWSSQKPNGHPAEKPVNLIAWLLEISGAKPGMTFLDPFAGCGTGLVAAQKLGLDWCGIEIDPGWAASTRERIAQQTAQAQLL